MAANGNDVIQKGRAFPSVDEWLIFQNQLNDLKNGIDKLGVIVGQGMARTKTQPFRIAAGATNDFILKTPSGIVHGIYNGNNFPVTLVITDGPSGINVDADRIVASGTLGANADTGLIFRPFFRSLWLVSMINAMTLNPSVGGIVVSGEFV